MRVNRKLHKHLKSILEEKCSKYLNGNLKMAYDEIDGIKSMIEKDNQLMEKIKEIKKGYPFQS